MSYPPISLPWGQSRVPGLSVLTEPGQPPVLRALRLPLAGPPVPRLAGCHKNDKARETGKTQLTSYLWRWWQALVRTSVGLADGFTNRFTIPI